MASGFLSTPLSNSVLINKITALLPSVFAHSRQIAERETTHAGYFST